MAARSQREDLGRKHQFHGVQPVLPVADVAASAAYFHDVLGFDIDFLEGDPPIHGRVTKGDGSWGQPVYVHLSRSAPDEVRPSSELRIHVGHDLDGLFEEYRRLEVPVVFAPVSQPWGLREFAVREINGHVLRFCAEAAGREPRPIPMLRLYDYLESGNAYKVRLLLSQLGRPFERVHLDILAGETRRPEYLAKNRNHRIPLVEWPDGRRLAESNAILFHLAEGSACLPADSWERAQVLQWLFFEQYSHEPYIAVVRFWHFAGLVDDNKAALPEKIERGYHAFDVMEDHLSTREFFVASRYSIADIALYAYTHVAHEGGFDLGRFPSVTAWLGRVASEPGHVRITDEIGELVRWP
jgi:glutathione S-transferase